jgi:hypothetical protein
MFSDLVDKYHWRFLSGSGSSLEIVQTTSSNPLGAEEVESGLLEPPPAKRIRFAAVPTVPSVMRVRTVRATMVGATSEVSSSPNRDQFLS